MIIDIVIPQNNEQEFIDMAKRLGYKALCFAYDRKRSASYDSKGLRILVGMLVNERTSGRPNNDVILARMPSRAVVERMKPDIIFELEQEEKKDYMHQRNSGLNHITAEICRKNGTNIGFSISSLLEVKNRARVLGRMQQNIRLARKYKLHMVIASFARSPYQMRAPEDMASLLVTIGMHQKETREGVLLL
jgi:hypothetical protein